MLRQLARSMSTAIKPYLRDAQHTHDRLREPAQPRRGTPPSPGRRPLRDRSPLRTP
ncbi:hypothetical protein GCM10027168_41810 [Streptomyces capparidis]